jgi:queuine tRNA-ribosyltransferase
MATDFRFEVVATDPDSRARAGRLHTPHGVIETPVFMPVGTAATVKAMTQQLLTELGIEILLANTYHLYLRPGHELIREMGGLHRFMAWPRAILTDSGGYQVFSMADLRKVTDEGVLFRSHLDGSEHFFSPEKALEVQLTLGADIVMQLDECIGYPSSHERTRRAMERSCDWARRSQVAFARGGGDAAGEALFGIIQGGLFADLRRQSAARMADMEFPGYAIGGLAVGEPEELSLEMTEVVAEKLPREKPCYMMGVGKPESLGEYVLRGVDMMDCVLPTRNARNGSLFTWSGTLSIKNSRYARDPRPIDEQCPCFVCRNYSRAYLRHLFMAHEILAAILHTYHNLFFYLDIMRRIRQAIAFGDLRKFLSGLRAMSEPDAALG